MVHLIKKCQTFINQTSYGYKRYIFTSSKAKKLSIAQTIYIINKILFPKLLYVGQLTALTKNEWEKLEQPILKFVKHQIGLASSFPTSALHHNGILGLHSLWQQFALMNVSNFIERINNINNA